MSLRPNILYINSHDTGRAIRPYGWRIDTPHLQALAEGGVLFRNAHCAAPTCSPSRAALCTGMYPHRVGQIGLGHRGFRITRPERHIARRLRDAGYDTVSWGMADNHTGGDPAVLGYQRHLGGGDDETGLLEWIRGTHDRPFFASVSYVETHRRGPGFGAAPDHGRYDPRYGTVPAALPEDDAAIRADWAHFCSDATALDRRMGRVFAALDEAGLADDTLVIATTDHGVPFPRHKCTLTSRGTGVFLIVRGPGFTGGRVVDALTSHLDLYPTICEVAGLQAPEDLDGVSLVASARGDGRPLHDEVFAEVSYHAAYEPMRAVRTATHLYVRRFGERRRPVLPNIDASPTKDALLARGLRDTVLPDEELYDLVADPQEMGNRIGDPALAGAADDMRRRLDAWMRRSGDPLVAGEVPMPDDAVTDDPDGLHPTGGKRKGEVAAR